MNKLWIWGALCGALVAPAANADMTAAFRVGPSIGTSQIEQSAEQRGFHGDDSGVDATGPCTAELTEQYLNLYYVFNLAI